MLIFKRRISLNDYEERKQARIDYYREKAEQARQESHQLYQQSSDMLSAIPPGQPILTDHHSARGHRRLLERAENNTAISSDDPDALDKLKVRLEGLKSNQAFMKKVNAHYRKHKTCQGCEGVSEELAAELDESMKKAYSWETAPFPSYALSNNNQNIKRIESRIQQLEHAKKTGYQGWDFEGGTVVPNHEENRLQIFFEEIPPEELRQELSHRGFHWSRRNQAWQRQLNFNAIRAASYIQALRPKDGTDPRKLQPKQKSSHGYER